MKLIELCIATVLARMTSLRTFPSLRWPPGNVETQGLQENLVKLDAYSVSFKYFKVARLTLVRAGRLAFKPCSFSVDYFLR